VGGKGGFGGETKKWHRRGREHNSKNSKQERRRAKHTTAGHAPAQEPLLVPEQPVLHLPAPQSAHLEQVPALLKGLAVPQEERHWPAGQLPQLEQEPVLAIPVLALVPQLTLYLPAPQESQPGHTAFRSD
jgi:hypothetical protein